MSESIIYSVRYFQEDGEQRKDLKPVGEIYQNKLALYMFPWVELEVEGNAEDDRFERVLAVERFIVDDEEQVKRYPIGYTKTTQYAKYLNLNMFRQGQYVIKDMTYEPAPAIE